MSTVATTRRELLRCDQSAEMQAPLPMGANYAVPPATGGPKRNSDSGSGSGDRQHRSSDALQIAGEPSKRRTCTRELPPSAPASNGCAKGQGRAEVYGLLSRLTVRGQGQRGGEQQEGCRPGIQRLRYDQDLRPMTQGSSCGR